jgi:hypothetical protein
MVVDCMTNGLAFCYILAKSEKRKVKSEKRKVKSDEGCGNYLRWIIFGLNILLKLFYLSSLLCAVINLVLCNNLYKI